MLTPWPALLVDSGERILVITDLHLGIEFELAKSGISIPYQTDRFLRELLGLIREYDPDRLLLLGDVKHGVPYTSFQERREIPRFFNALLEEVPRIGITRGNHDASIDKYLPEEVSLYSSKGVILGRDPKIAAFHGHAWPHPTTLSSDIVLVGHNHPTVLIPTPIGLNISKRAWIKGDCNVERLAATLLYQGEQGSDEEDPVAQYEMRYQLKVKDPKLIIIPTFNDLLGGLAFNAEPPKSLLGPLLSTDSVSVDDFDVYLLDGNYMGKVGFLRELLEKNSDESVYRKRFE
jgi:hypothetical protein